MDRYRVKPGDHVKLKDWDPNDKSEFDVDKKGSVKVLEQLTNRLESLQELFFAEGKHRLLIVLQATDTAGKDGVIRHVFDGVNPQGVKVAAFKVPSAEELAHDYLWRVHRQTPGKGEVTLFNRSHYEDVLVVRVHNLVPEEVWTKRYEQIVSFEQMLADEGTTILKFYLHIDKDEQKARLQERLDDPSKHWKFSVGDLAERKLWAEYEKAYEDALEKTSTDSAPWYIIPSNRKWYRNLVISQIIIDKLESLNMEYPQPKDDLSGLVIE